MSRRVLITGAASGLGAALAARFAGRGDRVLVTDVAQEYAGGPGTAYACLDVTSEPDWQAARDHVHELWGGLDVLVNNAGIAAGGRIEVVTPAEWRRIVEVNLLGVAAGCRTFIPMLKAQADGGERGGHIVNIASVAGLVHPAGMASYNAVKAGVVALSETLEFELAPWGIATSVVCPSFFRTGLAASLAGTDQAMDHIARRLIDRAPLSADQVADTAMRGIDARRPVITTDRLGRMAWRAKRFARPLYRREQRRNAERMHVAAQRHALPTSTTEGS